MRVSVGLKMRKKTVAAGKRALLGALIGVGAIAAFSRPALAQYSFTNVADSTSLSGINTFGYARINDVGTVAFLAGSGALNTTGSYYLSSGGTTTRVIGNGDAAPIGSTFSYVDNLYYTLDNSNRLTFSGNVTTGGTLTTANNKGLFRYDNGTVTTLVQTGTTVLPSGGTTSTIGAYSANNNGTVALQLTSPTWAIYKIDSGNITTLVTQGATANGTINGKYNTFSFPVINDNGSVTFYATLSGDPISNLSVNTVSSDGKVTAKVAANGDTSPGTSTNSAFTYFSKGTGNDAGQVAFIGGATPVVNGAPSGQQLRGIWLQNADSSISLIALQGQAAPGGGVFGATYTLGNINESGFGVFLASSMTGAVSQASYVFSSTSLVKILGVGDSLFDSTVTAVGVPYLNDLGQITLDYTLANNVKGVLVANAVTAGAAAPEPGTIAFLMMGGAALMGGKALRVRRRRLEA